MTFHHQLTPIFPLHKKKFSVCSYETTINDLFQDLSETFTSCANGQFELEESVEAMLEVIKAVNDSLHQINIKVGAS